MEEDGSSSCANTKPTTTCTQMNIDEMKNEQYPTSKTIPFPYPSGPYPQQAALMDALLGTLKLLEEDSSTSSFGEVGDNPRNPSCSSSNGLASVILLESPTGTGKSLSLACSSLAWLRYKERQDLIQANPKQSNCQKDETAKDDTDATTSSNAAACSKSDQNNDTSSNNKEDKGSNKPQSLDWLDAWVPASEAQQREQEEQQQQKLQEECYHRATSTRKALNTHLNSIRARIRKSLAQKSIASGREGGGSKDSAKLEMRKSRDGIAKMDIESMLQEESTQQRRRRGRNKYTPSSGNKDTILHTKAKESMTDFCLEDYHSDDNHQRSARSFQDEMLPDDDNAREVENSDGVQDTKGKPKSLNGDIIGTKLPYEVIDGGQLDGSGVSTRGRRHMETKKDNTVSTHFSIGNVQPGSGIRKIVYAARTHSQLSQFVDEVRRTAWGECPENTVRVVSLGGRKLLCGNRDVTGPNRKNSEAWITEKCLDMQKGMSGVSSKETSNETYSQVKIHGRGSKRKNEAAKKTAKKCPLMQSREARSSLALHMLAQPSDIEDLSSLGLSTQTCGYYASREALAGAEVVAVPYNLLLSKQARESVGLSLQQCLVIIDEAHNIPEALRSLSSCRLTLSAIEGANGQLAAYTQRYSSRLNSRNLFYLGQIRRFLMTTSRYLQRQQNKNAPDEIVTATDLLFRLKLDNINLFNVIKYLENSKLSNKLLGFNNTLQMNESDGKDDTATASPPSKHISSMSIVEEFMKCLTAGQKEGRVMIRTMSNGEDTEACLCFLLLNPSLQFRDVLEEAYAVCLAGGTLAPFQHIATELFGGMNDNALLEQVSKVEKESIDVFVSKSLTVFTCGHVIPKQNVTLLTLSTGPSGCMKLDFRHGSRSDALADELGHTLLKVCGVVPNGLVVFFPSYAYEAEVALRWMQTGMYEKIRRIKKIYREPKKAGDIETTLKSYSKDANSYGACLLAVIGGKMSEGINFAGSMARCVLVVGVPYPNPKDPELQEKMRLLDKNHKSNSALITGKVYYHNLCMRAINQSVGRAIRNINDYAAVILADARYSTNSMLRKDLPKWLNAGDSVSSKKFDENLSRLTSFFNARGH